MLSFAFFISAIIHHAGDYMLLGYWGGGSFTFFMLQPCAITFEELVIGFSRRAGIQFSSGLSRIIGLVWVGIWFAYTAPILLEPHLRAGFFEDANSVSLILGVWEGKWVPS